MYKKILLSSAAVVATALCAAVQPAMAEGEDIPQLRNSLVFFGVESFTFKEYLGSDELTNEKGLRGTVGIGWSNLFVPTGGAVYRAAITGYGGLPSYTCYVCAVDDIESESRYLGLRLEGMGGYRFGSKIGTEVFTGIALDFWNRSIQDAVTSGGATIYGYDTYNAVGSFKLGVSLIQRFNTFGYFLRAGVKAPFVAWQRIDYLDGVEVSPGLQMSPFASLDLTFGTLPRDRFVLSIYYDSMNLARSNTEDLYDNGSPTGLTMTAPASKMSAIGVQLAFGF